LNVLEELLGGCLYVTAFSDRRGWSAQQTFIERRFATRPRRVHVPQISAGRDDHLFEHDEEARVLSATSY